MDFNGSDSLTFTVNDSTVSSAPATISVTVVPVNDAPVLTLSGGGVPYVQSKLNPTGNGNWGAGDQYGIAVAVDGNVAVVGAYGDDSNQSSAYVFEKDGGVWTLKARLIASDGASNDYFGYSVAVSGDTAVVGAVGDDGVKGAAYVYVKPGSGWSDTSSYTAKLTAGDGASGVRFGNSVAISGDTVVVGAWLDESVYVYVKPNPYWSDMAQQTAKLTASGGAQYDRFGTSVAVSGDTVVVGASLYDYAGGAFVFEGGKTTIAYTENGAALALDGALTVSDMEDTLASATIRLTGHYVASEDILSVNNPHGLTSNWDASTGTLILSGSAAPADYEMVLRTVAYSNSSDNPDTGQRTISMTVNDGMADSNTAIILVDITAVNDAPETEAQSVTTDEDTSKPITLTGWDVEGAALTFTVVSVPSRGTLSGTAPNLTYTPALNFNGTDSFTFTVNDGAVDSTPATVNIAVIPVNDAPVAQEDSFNINEDEVLAMSAPGVLGNDSDVDGDTLIAALATSPAHGSVTLQVDGSFTYTPEENYNGPDSFTYTVSDGQGGIGTVTANITVNAINDAPLASNDTLTVNEDTSVSITVLDNDMDADNETLSVSAVTNPSHGNAVANDDGTITYSPSADFHGSDTFIYTVSDAHGGTDTAELKVTVTPVNDRPVAQDDSVTTDEDTPITITVLANDTDVDGDALTVSISTPPANGSATAQENGTIVYTPNANFYGFDTFTYCANDGYAVSMPATVTITVNRVNTPPYAGATKSYAVTQGEVLTIAKPGVLWDANDAEGDVLTSVLLTPPTMAEQFVLNEDGSFTYKSSVGSVGPDTFQYAVSDGQDNSAPKTVTINIQIPGSVPSNESYVEAGDGSTVVFYDPLVGNTTVSLTFDHVTEAGTVTVTSVNNPGPPEGFHLGNPPVTYEIHTTAVFSGSIQVSFNYSGIRYRKESSLRLYHYQNGAWVDVTESVDTAQKVIYGTVTTLSPFVIVEPNELPTAVITPLADCYEGITAILSASASSDPENDSLLFAWDLDNDHQFDDGTGENALITPIDNGIYVVNLQVQDAWGGMDITQMELAVSNVAPTIYIPPILPLAPVPITETITTTFYVKDSGAQDNLTAVWNWGETIDPGLVEPAGEAGVWKVSGAKRYSQPGFIQYR